MKRILTLTICFLASLGIVVGLPLFLHTFQGVDLQQDVVIGKFDQKVTGVLAKEHSIYKLYEKGELIGVLENKERLEAELKRVYAKEYEEQYPNSALHLGRDLYYTKESSYQTYSGADEKIFDYLHENALYTLETTKFTFTGDDGVTGALYVLDPDLYDAAMTDYLSLFVDKSALSALNNGDTITPLTTYGTKDVGVYIEERIEKSKANAEIDEILTTKEQVLEYLEYGSDTEKEYYTVQAYDTVAGVGAKNYGLSATQVMNINKNVISSTDQVLEEGTQLCITYFQSPLTVIVYKDSLRAETVYYKQTVAMDESLKHGEEVIKQEGRNGTRNALYSEKWINGVLVSGTLQSSVVLQTPTDEVVTVGSMIEPGVGTGQFRYPTENAHITCNWGCYYGHRGTDFVDAYNSWGDVYAADSGVIETNSYNGVNGNYVIINHNNGFKSYYGHMRVRSDMEVGTIVEKGQMIGHIGMTGVATGPHVHFFVELDGERHNACEFLDCDAVQ